MMYDFSHKAKWITCAFTLEIPIGIVTDCVAHVLNLSHGQPLADKPSVKANR